VRTICTARNAVKFAIRQFSPENAHTQSPTGPTPHRPVVIDLEIMRGHEAEAIDRRLIG